ncbi:MAG: UxaA family hydrolase [Verrucomicrobia bacterium]|nr:UxaA family hydrolase [Verrucomicrobiota bacterium]
MQNTATVAVPTTDSRLLRISPRDNVFVAIATIEAGEEFQVDGKSIHASLDLPLGHKVAARDIAPGQKIIKYGVPIGSAILPIPVGEHVHTHNIKSDYLPTYTWKEQGKYFKEHH